MHGVSRGTDMNYNKVIIIIIIIITSCVTPGSHLVDVAVVCEGRLDLRHKVGAHGRLKHVLTACPTQTPRTEGSV